MANRTTVKNNIITQNVPTVTNAILTGMLNTELADNIKFREDVAVAQSSGATNITVNFTGRDRVDLTRTGGALNITVSGIADGEEVDLLITKTVGQPVTWVGVTDITPIKENVTSVPLVLYSIRRKGANYYAKAWVETVVKASDAETITGTETNKLTTPANIQAKAASSAETITGTATTKFVTPAAIQAKTATDARMGISQKATQAFVNGGVDDFYGGEPLYVPPSTLQYFVGGLRRTIISIGDWNMVTSSQATIAHGLDYTKIRGVSVAIRADSGSVIYNFNDLITWSALGVVLTRASSGTFDNANFDSTSFNRGYIIIEHTP